MSKEKECKCCKRIWYEDMLDKKLELCPTCYEYCKPLIDGLKIKDKKIADLQHKLKVAEKALNKMSNYAINDNDLYDLVSDFNIENERYDEDHFGIDTCDVVDYFKTQAEKEVKGE